MNHHEKSTTPNARFMLIVWLLTLAMVIVWPFFLGKPTIEYINRHYIDLYALPELWSLLSLVSLALGPPFLLFFGVSIYFGKWRASHRSQLIGEQLTKLSNARNTLRSAVISIENIEQELRFKSEQTAKLEAELASLTSLNAETATELRTKLDAMQILNRRHVWFERTLSFVIGVVSSLVASYAWQYVITRAS